MSGYDRLDRRAEREAGNLADRPGRTVLKWIAAFAAFCVVCGVVFGIIGWVGSWGDEVGRVTGAQNSREQTTAVLDDVESMKAAAGNICSAQNAKSDENSPTLVEDPAFAYKATYRRIAADYNRRMSNFFEAAVTRQLPIPAALGGLPRTAPSLSQALEEAC